MVKMSEIRNFVAGDWYPPPVSKRVLGYINNVGSANPVAISDWKGDVGAGYISIGLSSPQDTPQGVQWEQDYAEIERYIDINANCLWRIDFAGSNLGPIKVAEVTGFPFEGFETGDIYGGYGFIVLHGGGENLQSFSGHIRIEYNTNFGRTHVDIPLYDSGDPSTDFAPLYIEPPHIVMPGAFGSSMVTIYNVFGGSINVVSSSPWIENIQFSQFGSETYDCTFDVSEHFHLCHNQREGEIVFEDGWGRMASVTVIQNPTKDGLPIVYDPMGVSYPYVQIGDYYVMIENLRTDFFANYTPISYISDPTSWVTQTSPAYCVYNNDWSYEQLYGYLYNGLTARQEMQNEGLVDLGEQPFPNDLADDRNWHIPSIFEWDHIITHAGANSEARVLGMKCNREVPANHPRWNEGLGGNNNSSFSALPSGGRDRSDGYFWGLGFRATFWTNSEYSMNNQSIMIIPETETYPWIWFRPAGGVYAGTHIRSGNAIRLVRRKRTVFLGT